MAMVLRKSSARWSPRKNGGGRSGISQNGNAYLDGFSDAWGTWQNPAVLPDAPTSAARDLGQERPDVPPARRRSLQARHPGGGGALSGRRPLRIGNSRSGDRGGDARLPQPSRRSLTAGESPCVGHNYLGVVGPTRAKRLRRTAWETGCPRQGPTHTTYIQVRIDRWVGFVAVTRRVASQGPLHHIRHPRLRRATASIPSFVR